MAILGHFEALISINGVKAHEYDDDEDPEDLDAVSKYVEVVSGANFEVTLEVKKHYTFDCGFLEWEIFLDGDRMERAVVPKSYYSWEDGRLEKRIGTYKKDRGQSHLAKFKFDDLEISDDRRLPHTSQDKVKNLGLITVNVWRYKLDQIIPEGQPFSSEVTSTGPIPEKALKGRAVTLAAGLDIPVPIRGEHCLYSGTKLDQKAVATFHFKYRTKASLQDLLIIPRTPAPIPLEERPIDELTIEQARELIQRQQENIRAHEERNRKFKNEDGGYKFKCERPESVSMSTRSYKIARSEEGVEIVDLVDDDDEVAATP